MRPKRATVLAARLQLSVGYGYMETQEGPITPVGTAFRLIAPAPVAVDISHTVVCCNFVWGRVSLNLWFLRPCSSDPTPPNCELLLSFLCVSLTPTQRWGLPFHLSAGGGEFRSMIKLKPCSPNNKIF